MLGKKMRDRISGFEGICTAVTTWLNGCVRMTLEPPTDKDGKPRERQTFDDHQLEVVGDGPVEPRLSHDPIATRTRGRVGGDRPAASRNPDPER